MNAAIRQATEQGIGMGEALGERLDRTARAEFANACLLLQAWRRKIPATVHVAIGADTHHDFRLFCSLVRELNSGGVFVNVGSAVVLPEVFLKAVSAVRNLGHPLADFTTVNLDFLQHYRPRVNVVERPHAQRGGQGYSIIGHHEILIPLLAGILADLDA